MSRADPKEIEKFDRLAAEWWDETGPMRPLHRQGPARLGYLRDRLVEHFARDPKAAAPLKGLKILDVGCGGGLIAEPLCRLGAEVTGLDEAAEALEVARRHAAEQGLEIDYRQASLADLAAEGAAFDAVLTLEVVERVEEPAAFLAEAAALAVPGGLLIASTLNRNLKSFGLAIVGAEYILRWLPRGTHDWRRFLRPSELAGALRQAGLRVIDSAGLAYDPLTDRWAIDPRDLDVNYVMTAAKPEID